MNSKQPIEVKELNAEEVVKSNPKMYWGTDIPTPNDVNRVITEQLELEGCKIINKGTFDEWQVISFDIDWVEKVKSRFGGIEQLFLDAKALPEGGGNALRFEYFLNLLCSSLQMWVDKRLILKKGSEDVKLKDLVTKNYPSSVCIFYKL